MSGWDQMQEMCPLALAEVVWPDGFYRYRGQPGWLYKEEIDILKSVDRNRETFALAANKMGKDFVTGLTCVTTALRAIKLGLTWRIITTSVDESHLVVLWAEIARFLTTSRYPLLVEGGGPLMLQSMELRDAREGTKKNPISYMQGRVSQKGEGLGGHHAEVTLAVGDEASGIEEKARDNLQGWAQRLLWIGNAWDCNNFFRKECEKGDLIAEESGGQVLGQSQ